MAGGINRDNENWKQLFEKEWNLFWSDESIYEPHLTFAYFRILVTDSKWIEHLSQGMIFESYASIVGSREVLVNKTFKRLLDE